MSDARTRKRQLTCLGITLLGGVFIICLLFRTDWGSEAARRTSCKTNLHRIGLALHSYYDEYGCFPPAHIADDHGRPMHSWRVLILPYLNEDALYAQYRFDEPWNGLNNSQLADRISTVYQCPTEVCRRDNRQAWTSYVAVIGPHTCWPGSEPVRVSDITDGTSETLFVVEIHNSGIHWMEPRDLKVTQMPQMINAPGMGYSSAHVGGAHGLLADGSVRFLSEKTPAETLRRLIERDDGEPAGEF